MNQIETKERKSRGKKSFPIVRVGASAGGLEAIETFFANMPTNVGMAFVVIQHLSPQHKSILGDILKKDTPMQVVEVQDGMNIVPSCIYLGCRDRLGQAVLHCWPKSGLIARQRSVASALPGHCHR